MFKAEAEGRPLPGDSSLVHNSGQSLGPGGRKLKAVDSGMDHLFEDDEDGADGARRRRNRELGEEGDLDEQVYENDFADDEEHMEVDDNDEEAKELEVRFFLKKKKRKIPLFISPLMIFQERLKKEYKSANKHRDTGVDESDEETEEPTTTKQAKAMQKLIRNREDNEAYESDDEKNPYATSVSLLVYLGIFVLLTILCRRRRRRNHPSLRQQGLLYNSSNNKWNLGRRLQNLSQLVQLPQRLLILERLPRHSLLDMAAIRLSPSVRRALRYQNPRRRTRAEAIALLEDNPLSQEAEVRALSLKHGMVFLVRRRV